MRTLYKGRTGEDVRYLQYFLGIEVDGQFGNGTNAAVKSRQKKDGLAPDGYVGPATQKKWGLSDFKVDIYDKSEVYFAGYPYGAEVKPPKTLKQWAIEENADFVYNLAFFNSRGNGNDKYGVIKGRTLTYLKAKGQDVGYGGTPQKIFLNDDNICSGYKLAVNDGIAKSVSSWGRRTRNANGLLKDGRYFHIQGVVKSTETAIRNHMFNNYDVSLMLIQDSGGSTAFYDWKKDVLLACEGRREGLYGRPVASVVCIKSKEAESEPVKTVCPMCNGTGVV